MAKILIIGGGVSGLSAGIYAQLNGHQAVVCEKHSVPGGNLTGWQRGEYHIDNCIHWLTGTNPASRFYDIWKDLGVLGDVEIMRGEALYTCELDGVTLGLYTDLERIRREMLAISPEDKKEINSLIRAVKLHQIKHLANYLIHLPCFFNYFISVKFTRFVTVSYVVAQAFCITRN